MDESTLRSYFRKVLGVNPGASRKELRQARDKRAQRWRDMLIQPIINPQGTDEIAVGQRAAAKIAEHRLAITNSAFDCLSNADKFRDFQTRLIAGEVELADLESMLMTLGESNVKPPAPRVLAKRQALQQEKMERITALVTEGVRTAGHDYAVEATRGKLPDADQFYDGVYKAAKDNGQKILTEELAALSTSKIEIDDSFKEEIEETIVDHSEMIAHKEYERLEEKAAAVAPTTKQPRVVALVLSVIIMGLVVSVCFYGATSSPTAVPTAQNGSKNLAVAPNLDAATAPVHVPVGASGLPAAPAAGIANSVFNRSVYGADNNAGVTPPNDVAGSQDGTTAQSQGANMPPANNSPSAATATASAPRVVPVNVISLDQAKGCEIVSDAQVNAVVVPDKTIATAAALVNYAGAAGMAGYPTKADKGAGSPYVAGIEAAMKGNYPDSLTRFGESYNAGQTSESLYNQGVVLGQLGNTGPAMVIYTKLIGETTAMPQAFYNRALVHMQQADVSWRDGNYTEWRRNLLMAVNNYDVAIKADPRLGQAYYNRGIVFFRLGQKDKAYADFESARTLMPQGVEAAVYNKDMVAFLMHKNATAPKTPAPRAPIGPVGPPGPK